MSEPTIDPAELRSKWAAYGARLREGDGVTGSLMGAAFIIARSGCTDVSLLADRIETLEKLREAAQRFKDSGDRINGYLNDPEVEADQGAANEWVASLHAAQDDVDACLAVLATEAENA